jgi:hypothetical protein
MRLEQKGNKTRCAQPSRRPRLYFLVSFQVLFMFHEIGMFRSSDSLSGGYVYCNATFLLLMS